jgi:hypothetical protein
MPDVISDELPPSSTAACRSIVRNGEELASVVAANAQLAFRVTKAATHVTVLIIRGSFISISSFNLSICLPTRLPFAVAG